MNIKRILCLLLIACMLLSLAACGKGSKPASTPDSSSDSTATPSTEEKPVIDTSERVDLVFYVMGDPPKDEQVVEDAINEVLLERLNATVDFRFSTWTDWAQKYNLELTSGSADLIYIANWINYGTLASSGAFLKLDDLLPVYAPKLLEIVDEGLFNQCRVNGDLYAVPATWPEYTVSGVKYREDLRKKYDLPVPNSIENFEAYLLGIKENDPNQGLLTCTVAESSGLLTAFDGFMIVNFKYPWVNINGLPYGLAANYDTPSDVYDYWYSEDFIEDCKLMKKWADLGFWSRSALSDPNNDEAFISGLCVAEIAGQNPNKHIAAVNDFAKNHPDWESAYIAYGEVNGVIYPAAATQNGTAITAQCKNPERALMVLELFMSDESVHRLVQYGIEGVHYEIDEEGYYNNLSENFMYENFNTWNLRVNEFKLPQRSDAILNELFKKYEELGNKTKWPNINVYGNFTENYEDYAVERGAVSDVMRQYLAPIQAGFVDDVEAAISQFLEKAEAAGLQKCREGFIEQYKAYCAEYGYDK